MNFNLLCILGATACGKTRLAVSLAKEFDGEILSADSRQVYRGMDLGTGKDLHEYGAIPYHLIDQVEPQYEYSLFDFQKDFYQAYTSIVQRNNLPILCGGTYLYIKSVLNHYPLQAVPIDPEFRQKCQTESMSDLQAQLIALNPKLHNKTDLEDRDRLIRALEITLANDSAEQPTKPVSITPLVLAIHWPRPVRTERIKFRLKQRLQQGMIAEVETLHSEGLSWERLEWMGLEYRLIAQYLQGQLNFNDMQQKLASAIVKFAKKQDTWLRKLEREGLTINHLEGGDTLPSQALEIIKQHQFIPPQSS